MGTATSESIFPIIPNCALTTSSQIISPQANKPATSMSGALGITHRSPDPKYLDLILNLDDRMIENSENIFGVIKTADASESQVETQRRSSALYWHTVCR
jgi:hypothetical protein